MHTEILTIQTICSLRNHTNRLETDKSCTYRVLIFRTSQKSKVRFQAWLNLYINCSKVILGCFVYWSVDFIIFKSRGKIEMKQLLQTI